MRKDKSRTTEVTWTVQLPKKFENAIFWENLKVLLLSNSYGSKTTPKNFFENISTNKAARGFQSFGLLEGAAFLPSKQWSKFLCQISAVIWWTYAENFKEISQTVFE